MPDLTPRPVLVRATAQHSTLPSKSQNSASPAPRWMATPVNHEIAAGGRGMKDRQTLRCSGSSASGRLPCFTLKYPTNIVRSLRKKSFFADTSQWVPSARIFSHNVALGPLELGTLARKRPLTPAPAFSAPPFPGILHATPARRNREKKISRGRQPKSARQLD
jgi:hypothetical protein